jgi:hypothetical protein
MAEKTVGKRILSVPRPRPHEVEGEAERQRSVQADAVLRAAGYVEQPDGTWTKPPEEDDGTESEGDTK